MKRQLFTSIIAGLIIYGGVSAQNQEEPVNIEPIKRKKHEINIGFTNLFSPNRGYYDDYYYPLYNAYDLQTGNAPMDLSYYPGPVYTPIYDRTQFGLGYKFHFGNNAARLMVSFMASNEESDNDPLPDSEFEYSNNENIMVARVGMEHTFVRLRKMDFYLALDGIYKSAEDKNESYSLYRPSNERYESSNTTTYTSYGAGLGLGIRFFVHENLSFSTETQIDYTTQSIETKNEYSSTGAYPSSSSYTSKTIGSNTRVNPLAVLSVNVHF